MSELKLVLVSGCPGIGKTTFAKELHEFIWTNGEHSCFRISYDEIMENEMENKLIENSEWKAGRAFVKDLIYMLIEYYYYSSSLDCSIEGLNSFLENRPSKENNMCNLIKEKFVNSIEKDLIRLKQHNKLITKLIIILDDIFYYESMRHIYFKLAFESTKNNISYFSYCIKTMDLNFLFERNLSREKRAQLETSIVENIFSKFEYPNQVDWEKNFSLIKLINTENELVKSSSTDSTSRKVLNEICLNHAKFREYVSAKLTVEQQKKSNLEAGLSSCKSLLHESDLILRKLIKLLLSDSSLTRTNLKIISQKLNEKKALLLSELRNSNSELYSKLKELNDFNSLEYELKQRLYADI